MALKIILIIILLSFLFSIQGVENNSNKKFWKKWYITKANFPMMYKGKIIWYSRSIAVVMFAFAKNKNDEWCILANKRGEGTPNFQFQWNCPCGYLDFNERGELAAVREAWEETGVKIEADDIQLIGTNTVPDEETQNVSFRYGILLPKKTNEYSFSKKHNEKNEVAEIKWIPLNEISNYVWAFNHLRLIPWAFKKLQENK